MKKLKLMLGLILLPLALAACSQTPSSLSTTEEVQVQPQATYVVPAWAIMSYSSGVLKVRDYWMLPAPGSTVVSDPASSYKFRLLVTSTQDLRQYRLGFNIIYGNPI
ncbi:hypothetical protein [Deinococcus cellulosilyticus]|uniref:Uncharacterized protein n=1 Tax=Deinococcus cellulosilyticus (strain DSM 18568 / NBRC 106333 / KACC 11606 / 5516J-15) TaxID=1223518 RepID=A0A511N335_DEIC1|nr:hypothetical protein [Deinococcus cellulosilyticus]GEM47269.1 hypothetical protein DC3_29040 [Deinococcus cellulosilyticus NBRC 106333 = KACC 11606]